jgi:hypothetical protein
MGKAHLDISAPNAKKALIKLLSRAGGQLEKPRL